MEHPLIATIIALACSCGMRLIWIYTYFPQHESFFNLLIIYPISWAAAMVLAMTMGFIFRARLMKQQDAVETA